MIAKRYIAEILFGLEKHHVNGFYFGDLHPQNILLDETGSVLLTHPGLTKKSFHHYDKKYVSPNFNPSQPKISDDYFSLGIIVYEIICGYYPFGFCLSEDEKKKDLIFPSCVSDKAALFINFLLGRDPEKAISFENAKRHVFLEGLEFNEISNMLAEPIFQPVAKTFDEIQAPLDPHILNNFFCFDESSYLCNYTIHN